MRRRTTLGLLLVGAAVAVPIALAGASAADTCLPGAPPGVPCVPVGEPTPVPSVSTSASPSPSASASPEPTSGSFPAPTGADAPASPEPAGGFGTATAPDLTVDGGVLMPPATAPLAPDSGLAPVPAGAPAPETAPADGVAPVSFTPAAATTRATVAQSLSGAFALVVGVLLVLPLLLAALAGRAARTMALAGPSPRVSDVLPAGLRRPRRDGTALRLSAAGLPTELAGALSAAISEAVSATVSAVAPATRTTSSRPSATRPGAPVNPSGTNRLYLGLGALAVAALAGFVGWYQLSANPNVNQQVPYLASAGVIVVIASAIGGALLVGDQLRGDDRRIEELEDAVRELAAALAPMIESPARRPAREVAYATYDSQPHDDVSETEVLEQEPVASVRRSRNGAARA